MGVGCPPRGVEKGPLPRSSKVDARGIAKGPGLECPGKRSSRSSPTKVLGMDAEAGSIPHADADGALLHSPLVIAREKADPPSGSRGGR
jgi:hypothetical protein